MLWLLSILALVACFRCGWLTCQRNRALRDASELRAKLDAALQRAHDNRPVVLRLHVPEPMRRASDRAKCNAIWVSVTGDGEYGQRDAEAN